MSRAALAWLAFVVPVWLVFVLCTYWEPIMRDGWGHFFWHVDYDSALERTKAFAESMYLRNNPRLGQVFTLLQYTPGPWHPIVTPILELALFYLLATLILGRWPSLRRSGDALLVATIIAMVFATTRSLGPMLFYRPFSGNYLFGFLVNVLWLVPFRLHAEGPAEMRAVDVIDAPPIGTVTLVSSSGIRGRRRLDRRCDRDSARHRADEHRRSAVRLRARAAGDRSR